MRLIPFMDETVNNQ